MSDLNHATQTAAGVFQAHFGAPPGSQDAKADCEKWQGLCEKLLNERERLRTELAAEKANREKAVLDAMCKDFVLPLTMEQVYALVDKETTKRRWSNLLLNSRPAPRSRIEWQWPTQVQN